MAGQIIVSSIKTDSDNSISFVSNTGATIFSANLASGLSIDSFGDNTITSDKIVSVANTKIAGNIVSSQITSVANTQLTGTVTNAQVGSSVYEGIGFRNRIINGDMRIDQRNAGASSTTNGVYTVDRWNFGTGVSGKMTYGQNYNSLTPPVGFTNYMGFETTTAHTVGAGEFFLFAQPIEGLNVSDLAWGSASAKTITLSFVVNSSLTGTFGGVISNSAQNRSYPFTYTISSANTWETKTVTIAGDTSGTWLTTNGVGINLYFGLGVGSTFNGTAGAWAGATYLGATGATSVVGTLNAKWNITGVQLEVGSVATPFERRPYGMELSLCQRYYEKSYAIATVPGTATYLGAFSSGGGATGSTTSFIGATSPRFVVEKRAVPTVTVYDLGGTSGVCQRWQLGVTNSNGQNVVVDNPSPTGFMYYSGSSVNASGTMIHHTASAEL